MTLRALVCLLILAGEANGQPSPSLNGNTLTADVLRDLPNGASLFAVLETVQPEVIADGFHSGGLDGGSPAHLAAYLASPRQTRYRVGDLEISNPVDGTPLLFPHLMPWDRAGTTTALMPLENNSPGLAIDLVPQSPGARWTGIFEAATARGRLITALTRTLPRRLCRQYEMARHSRQRNL